MSRDDFRDNSPNREGRHPALKEWVRRLVAAQGLNLSEKQLGWWSVHLEEFLRYCRKRGERVEARILARGFYDVLAAPEAHTHVAMPAVRRVHSPLDGL